MSSLSAVQGKDFTLSFLANGGIPGSKFAGWEGVVTLGVTKKVPLSGEVWLGSYRMARLGDLISHDLINC